MYMSVLEAKLHLVGRDVDFLPDFVVKDRYHRWATDRRNGGRRGLKLSYNLCDRRGRQPLNYTLELFYATGESTGLRLCLLCNSAVEQRAAIAYLFSQSHYVLA